MPSAGQHYRPLCSSVGEGTDPSLPTYSLLFTQQHWVSFSIPGGAMWSRTSLDGLKDMDRMDMLFLLPRACLRQPQVLKMRSAVLP